jgi:hypothetical protein
MKQFYILLIATATCSCTHVYYAPNTAHPPLLSEKGETRVNALYSSGGDSEFGGAELQVAHAFNKNFGAMVNYFTASESEETYSYSSTTNSNIIEKGSGSYIEFAGGYFKSLDPRKRWIGEVYTGTGFGTVKNDYGYGDNSKVGIVKFFVQPAVGYKSPYFEFAFVPKFSLVHWKVKEENIKMQQNSYNKDDLSEIIRKPNFFAFEPAIILRGGSKNFKLQLGLSFSKVNAYSYFDLQESVNGSIGISVSFKSTKK